LKATVPTWEKSEKGLKAGMHAKIELRAVKDFPVIA
jgi:hypothetical protein